MKLEILHRLPDKTDPSRPPILFVHGSYASARVWESRFMPYFAGKGYPCHAVSLRGHGRSEGSLSWSGLADYVEDVAGSVAELAAPPVLIGHSMGGLVAQHVLSRHKLRAAVLMATVPPSGLGSSVMHMSMFAPNVLWQLGLLQSLGPEAVSADVMARAMLSMPAAPGAGQDLLSHLQRESPRVATELMAPSQPTPPKGAAKPPILVIGGDSDVFLPVSAFREAATFFEADLQIMHGAPHAMMVDERWWQAAADNILTWLAKQLA